MATWDDVSDIALGLPEAVEDAGKGGEPSWSVRGKSFAWERPLSRAMVAELGDAAPSGPVLAVMVEDLGVRQAPLEADPAYFVVEPFRDFPAVLVRLDDIDLDELRETLVEGWLAVAPRTLAKEHFG